MVHQYKAAAFDLDGTLLDTSAGVLASVRYTIDKFGFEPLTEAQLKNFIGPPIQDSFARQYNLKGNILQEIATVFRDRYKNVDLLKAVPYSGIYDVFKILNDHGIKPVIATYKRQDYATMILKHFHFDEYTDIMYGADHENKLKKKDIIEMALKDAGISDFSEAVMIGDSDNDAIGANAIGTDFIGVTYGFGFKSHDDVIRFHSVGVADSTMDITKIILGGTK